MADIACFLSVAYDAFDISGVVAVMAGASSVAHGTLIALFIRAITAAIFTVVGSPADAAGPQTGTSAGKTSAAAGAGDTFLATVAGGA